MSIVHDCFTFWPVRFCDEEGVEKPEQLARRRKGPHSATDFFSLRPLRALRHCVRPLVCLRDYLRRPGGRKQNELLRVLRASEASTQRTRRVSVASVFRRFLATENTENKNASRYNEIIQNRCPRHKNRDNDGPLPDAPWPHDRWAELGMQSWPCAPRPGPLPAALPQFTIHNLLFTFRTAQRLIPAFLFSA
jgi:hypothetical protein